MEMFMLNPIQNEEAIGKSIAAKFGNDALQLPGVGAWLIAYPGTAKELSDEIGITSGGGLLAGEIGTGVIVSVGTYYGRAPTDIWEWMKVRMERK